LSLKNKNADASLKPKKGIKQEYDADIPFWLKTEF
jgi:hypothetical protein